MWCLDKPKIFVHEEYELNKETEHLAVLKLICSVQVRVIIISQQWERPGWSKYRTRSSSHSHSPQAFPAAQTKWNRNDQELPAQRVNQIIEEGKHILEIRKPRKVTFLQIVVRLEMIDMLDMFQSDAGVYTCEAGNSEGEISAVLTIEENKNMLEEAFEEFLDEVPEMMKDIQQTSGAASSSSVTFLLSSVLVVTMRNNAWLRFDCDTIQRTSKNHLYFLYIN